MMEYFIEYKYANVPNNNYWFVQLVGVIMEHRNTIIAGYI